MSVTKRKHTWSLRFRPFGGAMIGLATRAKTKFEAEGIEREILLACRTADYSCMGLEAREVCIRMFSNQGWELPPGLLNATPEKLTLWRAAEIFLNDPEISNSPRKSRHIDCLKHLIMYFGKEVSLEKIWVPELKGYQARRLEEGAANSTCNVEMTSLSKLFAVLIQHRLVRENPVRLLKALSTKGSERQSYISFKDVARIADACPVWYGPLVWTSYFTGMRRGEILSLNRDRIDLSQRMIYIGASETKENAKKRVPIHADLVPILKAALRTTRLGNDKVFLLQDNKGVRAIETETFKNCWPRACEALKLEKPWPRFHDLRHTFKTNCMESGVAEEIRERIMGHSDKHLSVSQRYGYISNTLLLREIDKLTVDHGSTRIWVEGRKNMCTPRVQEAPEKEKLRLASKL